MFCLFSQKVDDAIKKRCAKQILKYWGRREVAYNKSGKLTTPILKEKTQLWELFGPGSWLFFHLIEGKDSLKKPVTEWERDSVYMLASNIVKT